MEPKNQGQLASQRQLASSTDATVGREPPRTQLLETWPTGVPDNNVDFAKVKREFASHLFLGALAHSSVYVHERSLFEACAQTQPLVSSSFLSPSSSLISSNLIRTGLMPSARHKIPAGQASLQGVSSVGGGDVAVSGVGIGEVDNVVSGDVCDVCDGPGSAAVSDSGERNQLGIDTVRLFFFVSNGFVSREHGLEVEAKQKQKRTRVLWTNDEEERVEGVQAYWRDAATGINVKIRPIGEFFGMNSIGCFVTFSVARLRGAGDNYAPGSHEETRAVFASVANQLASLGINVDISQACVSRLDLFKNLTMKRPCGEYGPVLDSLLPSRMKNQPYPTGCIQGNKQHQLGIYDKRLERVVRGRDVDALPEHVLRLEYRFFRSAKVKDGLGFNTVGELLDNLERLEQVYDAALRKYWFRKTPQLQKGQLQQEQLQKPPSGITTACLSESGAAPSSRQKEISPVAQKIRVVARYLKKKLPRPLPQHLTKKSLQCVVEQEGVEGYDKVLKEVSQLSHQYVSNAVSAMQTALLQETAHHQPEFFDLYEELYSKALGASKESVDSKASVDSEEVPKIENVFVPVAARVYNSLLSTLLDTSLSLPIAAAGWELWPPLLCQGGISTPIVQKGQSCCLPLTPFGTPFRTPFNPVKKGSKHTDAAGAKHNHHRVLRQR